MLRPSMIRVLLRCQAPGSDLIRTLVSLSCQDVGPARLEVALASTTPEAHDLHEFRLLCSALGFRAVEIVDARGLTGAQALNRAAKGEAGHLVLAPVGTRLHPHFLSRCLAALAVNNSQAAFCGHTGGSPDGLPFCRTRPFRPEQLTRRNPVGPAAVIRTSAWEMLDGLRSGLRLALWDLWLRLALGGGGIAQVPALLATCPGTPALIPGQDGHAKAMLVVSSPGAFEPDVCRWAMSHLRGEPWATPFESGQIPGPRDVLAMFAGFEPSLRPLHAAWSTRRKQTA